VSILVEDSGIEPLTS